MMTQIEAFPLKVLSIHYFHTKRTAHAVGRALCDDGGHYIVKTNTLLEDYVCATDWLGHGIAETLKIPVPDVKVLQLADGSLVFGSRELDPRLADIEVSQLLTSKTQNDLYVADLAETLSAAYALDLIIGNADRHECNYVVAIGGRDDERQRYGTISVIDYSSADILKPQKQPIPFARQSNTMRAGRLIREAHGFVHRSARETIARLRHDRSFIAERAMWGMPHEWLPKQKRDEFRNWMIGSSFSERLERIESGLENGSFL